MEIKRNNYPYYFILPALLVYFIFYIVPTLSGLILSFTDWNSYGSSIKFIGLTQFIRLFNDDTLWIAFKNTIIYSIGTVFFQNLFALVLALLLNNKFRTAKIFRSVFFLPCILSPLVVGFIFSAIFYPDGMFTNILKIIGLKNIDIQWLANPQISLYVIIFVAVWFRTGIYMAIYLAALQNIPDELIDAAKIDGASGIPLLLYIKLPLINAGFTINIVFSLISSLKVFAIVFILTTGGPGRATEVFNTFIFKEFAQGRYAYSTAIGLLLFVFIAIVVIPVLLILKRREVEI